MLAGYHSLTWYASLSLHCLQYRLLIWQTIRNNPSYIDTFSNMISFFNIHGSIRVYGWDYKRSFLFGRQLGWIKGFYQDLLSNLKVKISAFCILSEQVIINLCLPWPWIPWRSAMMGISNIISLWKDRPPVLAILANKLLLYMFIVLNDCSAHLENRTHPYKSKRACYDWGTS